MNETLQVPVPDYTIKFPPKDRPASERRGVPARKFINPKKGSTRDHVKNHDRNRKCICHSLKVRDFTIAEHHHRCIQ